MTIKMRPYQTKAIEDVYKEWSSGNQFVVLVMPTGSGKSATLCEIARMERDNGKTLLILAHRRELITQLSHTLARGGLKHSVLASSSTVKAAHKQQIQDFGHSFVVTNSRVFVGSVQSLKPEQIERFKCYKHELTVIQDEFHHATKKSKTWGSILTPLDEAGALGLGVTATPLRADGQGLSRETDGYGDCMVLGPTARELINMGYLSEYRIYAPPSDLKLNNVLVSKSTGDYQEKSLKAEIGKSHIVGDVVDQYLRIAKGKPGLTFTVGVEMAEIVAEQYRSKGVPAIALSGKSATTDRDQAIKDIQSGKILQIVNDMLFTEGTDIPCVEVVSFARPTQSYGLYCQMFGRALRPAEGKSHAIIIDHVGNVARHGLPDAAREWSLDRREKRTASDDATPVRTCMNEDCFAVYERYLKECPFCGTPIPVPTPSERTGPEHVDGDLYELDADTLARMRGEVAEVDAPVKPLMSQSELNDIVTKHARSYHKQQNPLYAMAAAKKFATKVQNQDIERKEKHEEQQAAIGAIREIMAHWAGHYRAVGRSDSEIFRRFYLRYGVDWLGAQCLSGAEMLALGERIANDIGKVD